MSGITGHIVARLTNVAVEGSCWFRCRFGCWLWCWFWRWAWAGLHRGVVDLELVATIPTTRADGNLKIKMSLKKELLVEYLLRWVIIGVNVDTHSTSNWGLWQVPLRRRVFDIDTSTRDQIWL